MKKWFLMLLMCLAFMYYPLLGQQSWNTTLIGRWANGPCYAVTGVGNIAYFGNGGYLEVVDVSNPAALVELAKALTPGVVWVVTNLQTCHHHVV